MKIQFQDTDLHKHIDVLAKQFGTIAEKDCQEYFFHLPPAWGSGKISGFVFDYGINLLLFNCRFKVPLTIEIAKQQIHPLHFHFCSKGEFQHALADDNIMYQLYPLAGSISSNPANSVETFHFPKGMEILHTNLQIIRSEYLNKVDCNLKLMPQQLIAVFSDVDSKTPFLYESNYSLPTAECIDEIVNTEYKELVRSAFTEAKALELLSLQLKQFEDDHDPDKRFVSLKKQDVESIMKAREILVSDLQDAPTIKELARMSGVNQQKLKNGFKHIYGDTINQYLRKVRLETAKMLLLEGNLSIRSIANRVGYTNQSHFSRRFKEEHGLLPKDMRQKVCNHNGNGKVHTID